MGTQLPAPSVPRAQQPARRGWAGRLASPWWHPKPKPWSLCSAKETHPRDPGVSDVLCIPYHGHRITTNDSNLIIEATLFSFILLIGLISLSSCMAKCGVKMLSELKYTFSKTCMSCLVIQHRGQWAAHKYSIKIRSNNDLMFAFKNLQYFFSELDWCIPLLYIFLNHD